MVTATDRVAIIKVVMVKVSRVDTISPPKQTTAQGAMRPAVIQIPLMVPHQLLQAAVDMAKLRADQPRDMVGNTMRALYHF